MFKHIITRDDKQTDDTRDDKDDTRDDKQFKHTITREWQTDKLTGFYVLLSSATFCIVKTTVASVISLSESSVKIVVTVPIRRFSSASVNLCYIWLKHAVMPFFTLSNNVRKTIPVKATVFFVIPVIFYFDIIQVSHWSNSSQLDQSSWATPQLLCNYRIRCNS